MANRWRTWRRLLARFYTTPPTKVKILEIGAYQGEATAWFLRNLCAHPQSQVVAVDTFEGSAEYTDTDFTAVETRFEENTRSTSRHTQVHKMKMTSYEALVQLNRTNPAPEFDIVFIDASHEAVDVLADGILAFPLLKTHGVMLFDDYLWRKLVQDHYCPKVAVDAFVTVMRPYIRVLKKGWQLILEKIPRMDTPVPREPLERSLRAYYAVFATDLQCTTRLPRTGDVDNTRHLPLRTVRWHAGRTRSQRQTRASRASMSAVDVHHSHPPPANRFIVPDALISSVRDVFAHPVVQACYAALDGLLANNQMARTLHAIGVPHWHRAYFVQYMRLLKAYTSTSTSTTTTPHKLTVLNFRYARDFCGRFWGKAAYTNYMRPAEAFRVQPHRFYDISCTSDYAAFQMDNLDQPTTRHTYQKFISSRLNLWSLPNWLSILDFVDRQIDLMIVSAAIPEQRMVHTPRRNTTYTSPSSSPSSVAHPPEPFRIHLRNLYGFVVCAFALLAQRDRGVACINLLESTLHTPLMQQVVFLLHRCYANVSIVYSDYNGVTQRPQLFCYGFRAAALTAQARTQLRQQIAEVTPEIAPYGVLATPTAPQHLSHIPSHTSLNLRVPTAFARRLVQFHRQIVKREDHLQRYQTYMDNVCRQLATLRKEDQYEVLAEHPTRLYMRWCARNYGLYQSLASK